MKKILPVLVVVLVNLGITTTFAQNTGVKDQFPEEKLGWHLGAQAYTFRKFTLEEALQKMNEANLRYVEIYPGQKLSATSDEKVNHHLSKKGVKTLKALLKKHHIKVEAYGVVNGENEEDWNHIFQFAKKMKIDVIVSEPEEKDLELVSQLADRFKTKVALHNHPNPSHYWNPDIVLAAINDRSKYLGAAGDVGHWLRSGLDPKESLTKLKGRLYHMHFKDLNEANNKDAHDVHWGEGVLGLSDVIQLLKSLDYKGMISAEYEYNWDNNVEDVKVSAENFRKAL